MSCIGILSGLCLGNLINAMSNTCHMPVHVLGEAENQNFGSHYDMHWKTVQLVLVKFDKHCVQHSSHTGIKLRIKILVHSMTCIEILSIFTRGQFWPSGIVIACVCVSVRVSECLCVYQSLACPHDNSSAVKAKITKLGSEMQNTLLKMPIIFGGDRLWPSSSNLTLKSNFTSFWACPHDNFSPI